MVVQFTCCPQLNSQGMSSVPESIPTTWWTTGTSWRMLLFKKGMSYLRPLLLLWQNLSHLSRHQHCRRIIYSLLNFYNAVWLTVCFIEWSSLEQTPEHLFALKKQQVKLVLHHFWCKTLISCTKLGVVFQAHSFSMPVRIPNHKRRSIITLLLLSYNSTLYFCNHLSNSD